MKTGILWIVLLMAVSYGWAEEPLPVLMVKIRVPDQEQVTFSYRAPNCYDPAGKQVHRILVNCVWPTTAFDAWAEERGIFVFHAVFSNSLCWKVEEGYGRAVMLGLEELKKHYRVATDQLLVYGVSRGGQFSNYFVTWKPEVVTAWVAGIPGILDRPNDRMVVAPGLVTAGEADSGRYQMMMQFLSGARKHKLPIMWRSYANTAHELNAESEALFKAFLSYHHERTKDLLTKSDNSAIRSTRSLADLRKERPAPPPPAYIGDAQEWKYYDIDSDEAEAIPIQFRVELPSEEIARYWADPEAMKASSHDE